MVQVAAWFVAGVAWPAFALSFMFLVALTTFDKVDAGHSRVWWFWVRSWLLSSGVAVAATAVALGVGR